MSTELTDFPLHVFNFKVELRPVGEDSAEPLCSGVFSECSGLEATMEPKVIKEGGRNFGALQRVGQVTFATVVLKRGMTANRDLWAWFRLVGGLGMYGERLSAKIKVFGVSGAEHGTPVLTWNLAGALPVKFKAADLNARGSDVGVEELQLAHQGLSVDED